MTTAERHRYEDAALAASYSLGRLAARKRARYARGWAGLAALLITVFVLALAYVAERNEDAQRRNAADRAAAPYTSDWPAAPLISFRVLPATFSGGLGI